MEYTTNPSVLAKGYKRYTVTTALPYANGPVHIGHLAGVYIPAAHSQVADVGVGGDVDAGKVADVDRAVGVRQGRGYCVTLVSFC